MVDEFFPLAPGSKVPAIKGGRGVLDATNDPATITMWWFRARLNRISG